MKILQVNCHYNYGSTGKIMYDIDSYLKKNDIVSIQCYARGKKIKADSVYKIAYEPLCKVGKFINKVYGRPYKWGTYSTRKFIKIFENEKPEIVHIHCINTYTMNIYSLLNYLKQNDIKTIITLHAEFMYTGGCSYSFECNQWREVYGCKNCSGVTKYKRKNIYQNWSEMKEAFEGFQYPFLILVSVSPWLKNRAEYSTILKGYEHRVVLNGIDTNVFYLRSDEEIKKIRKKYGIFSEKVLLHVTSDYNAPIKGGRFISQLSKLLIKDRNNMAEIVVVGPASKQVDSENIKFLGVIKNQNDLAVLYSMAILTLLTSKRETFSMICAESLCCGTPIIGFKAGAPETIAMSKYSRFIDNGDINTLYRKVKEVLNSKKCDKKKISQEAKIIYSSEKMAQNYYTIYKEMIHDQSKS